jgi:hypothetical protein
MGFMDSLGKIGGFLNFGGGQEQQSGGFFGMFSGGDTNHMPSNPMQFMGEQGQKPNGMMAMANNFMGGGGFEGYDGTQQPQINPQIAMLAQMHRQQMGMATLSSNTPHGTLAAIGIANGDPVANGLAAIEAIRAGQIARGEPDPRDPNNPAVIAANAKVQERWDLETAAEQLAALPNNKQADANKTRTV